MLGSLSFSSASVGNAERKIRWRGWLSFHIGGMSASVIVLATAFYVDNGPRFVSQVPTLVYWLGPSVVGIPLLTRAFVRHSQVMAELRATAHNVAPPGRANRGPHTRVAPIQVAAGDSAQFTDPDGNLVGLVKGMRQRN